MVDVKAILLGSEIDGFQGERSWLLQGAYFQKKTGSICLSAIASRREGREKQQQPGLVVSFFVIVGLKSLQTCEALHDAFPNREDY